MWIINCPCLWIIICPCLLLFAIVLHIFRLTASDTIFGIFSYEIVMLLLITDYNFVFFLYQHFPVDTCFVSSIHDNLGTVKILIVKNTQCSLQTLVHFRSMLLSHQYKLKQGPSWSYGSWVYNYLCNQCLSPLTLRVRIRLRRGFLNTTLCDKVCQSLAAGQWFSPGTPDASTYKTDHHDINEILLKVSLNTITLTLN